MHLDKNLVVPGSKFRVPGYVASFSPCYATPVGQLASLVFDIPVYVQPGTCNLQPGTWNLELGTWNLEPGTWNPELRTQNYEPGTLLFSIDW